MREGGKEGWGVREESERESEGGREGGREGASEKVREGVREGGMGREREEMEKGKKIRVKAVYDRPCKLYNEIEYGMREREREGGRERGREEGREGGREGGRQTETKT